jgi:prepilin-type N-terminal cleavage/methylation domain-containing protein
MRVWVSHRSVRSATRRKGFSLVELAIVSFIIGSIASIAVPRFSYAVDRAYARQVQANQAIIQNVVDRYAAEHSDIIPGTSKLLAAALSPYIRQIPVNPNVATNADGIAIRIGGVVSCNDIPCGWEVDDSSLGVAQCGDTTCTGGIAVVPKYDAAKLGLQALAP